MKIPAGARENRRELRYDRTAQVRLFIGAWRKPVTAQVCDVSAHGMRLHVAHPLRRGTEYRFSLADAKARFKAVWVRQAASGEYEVGCRLRDPAPVCHALGLPSDGRQRRTARRVAVRMPGWLRRPNGDALPVRIVDLSWMGARLKTPESLGTFAGWTLEFRPPGADPISLPVRVIASDADCTRLVFDAVPPAAGDTLLALTA